uniref:FGAR-AT PurM N-terminal-like domain-containing protein n=1 Tax=Plectus sambesii TaxID=2011161 RepID=A0A914XCJ2_9BILA
MLWLSPTLLLSSFHLLTLFFSTAASDICLVRECLCDFFTKTVSCHGTSVVFENVPQLPDWTEELWMWDVGLSALRDHSFRGAPHLRLIKLNNCGLSFMVPAAFSGLNHLDTLDLADNRLWALPQQVFVDLPRLKRLDLSGNRISNLDQFHDALPAGRILEELLLSRNPLQSVSVETRLPLVRGLAIANVAGALMMDAAGILFAKSGECAEETCRFLSLSADHFDQLNMVDVSGCGELEVAESFLIAAHNATVLKLAETKLPAEESLVAVIESLVQLKELNVSGAQIANLRRWSTFPESLETLDISRLGLETLEMPGTLSGRRVASGLRRLVANQNRLSGVVLSADGMKNLVRVELSDNQLTAMPSIPPGARLPQLIHLDLGGNRIRTLGPHALSPYSNLVDLWLPNNQLDAISKSAFPTVGLRMQSLNLSSNRLSTLPRLIMPTLGILDASNNQIDKLDGDFFEGLPMLEHVYFNDNVDLMREKCRDLRSLLNTFECYDSWVRGLTGLGSLVTLDLSRTSLTALPARLLSGLHTLKTLNLAGNHMTVDVLDFWAHYFAFPPCMTSIDISANRLKSLGNATISLQHMACLQHVDFSRNPLECDCELAELKHLVRPSAGGRRLVPNIDDESQYFCFAASNHWQYPLKPFLDTVESCDGSDDPFLVVLKTLAFLASVMVGLVLIYIVICKVGSIMCGRKWARDLQYFYKPLSTWGSNTDLHSPAATGGAVAVGEQPIKGLISAAVGSRMSVGEALTNLVFAPITDLRDVKCSGNWMWAAKLPGEGAQLVRASDAMCEVMKALGVAVDGGKDSLSMAAKVGNEIVKAPGALVVSAYAPCVDITRTVTPDLKGD